MKRSLINEVMRSSIEELARHHFFLPGFAFWTPEQWRQNFASAQEIVEAEMGWDITDFGKGDFAHFGLFLFTIRNGKVSAQKDVSSPLNKQYCEKVMIVRPGQMTPMHFHWHKMEDIINRGGSTLVIELFRALPGSEELDRESEVTCSVDGIPRTVAAGGKVFLKPGESITLRPLTYHAFWAEGDGPCIIGEVSLVNDDTTDNRFASPIGRFPTIVEDEPPLHLLTKDYRKLAETTEQ